MQHSNTFFSIAFNSKRERIVWGILSGINWSIRLIVILAAGQMISGCSPLSRTGVESMVPKHISTNEDNKTVVMRFFKEIVGQGNLDVVNALLAPNCRYFDAGSVRTTNVSEFIDYLKEARLPFDSIYVKIDNIIAEGGRVAVRCSYHLVIAGEHSVVLVMADFLLEDGRIVEMWRCVPPRNYEK
jgi:predicted SnoaL-like aldol condensation-catalyzing enzyme